MITVLSRTKSSPKTIFTISTESSARLGMGDRAHERLVGVLDVAVDHVEVPLVHRQVDRLAQGAAAVVQAGRHVGELHEVAEVLDRGVAATVVEVMDEGRSVGGSQHHVGVADLTLRSGLRACWVKLVGAEAWMISRHMPSGKRTRVPSTSAPAPAKIASASG
jgi:hypothetical protein